MSAAAASGSYLLYRPDFNDPAVNPILPLRHLAPRGHIPGAARIARARAPKSSTPSSRNSQSTRDASEVFGSVVGNSAGRGPGTGGSIDGGGTGNVRGYRDPIVDENRLGMSAVQPRVLYPDVRRRNEALRAIGAAPPPPNPSGGVTRAACKLCCITLLGLLVLTILSFVILFPTLSGLRAQEEEAVYITKSDIVFNPLHNLLNPSQPRYMNIDLAAVPKPSSNEASKLEWHVKVLHNLPLVIPMNMTTILPQLSADMQLIARWIADLETEKQEDKDAIAAKLSRTTDAFAALLEARATIFSRPKMSAFLAERGDKVDADGWGFVTSRVSELEKAITDFDFSFEDGVGAEGLLRQIMELLKNDFDSAHSVSVGDVRAGATAKMTGRDVHDFRVLSCKIRTTQKVFRDDATAVVVVGRNWEVVKGVQSFLASRDFARKQPTMGRVVAEPVVRNWMRIMGSEAEMAGKTKRKRSEKKRAEIERCGREWVERGMDLGFGEWVMGFWVKVERTWGPVVAGVWAEVRGTSKPAVEWAWRVTVWSLKAAGRAAVWTWYILGGDQWYGCWFQGC